MLAGLTDKSPFIILLQPWLHPTQASLNLSLPPTIDLYLGRFRTSSLQLINPGDLPSR